MGQMPRGLNDLLICTHGKEGGGEQFRGSVWTESQFNRGRGLRETGFVFNDDEDCWSSAAEGDPNYAVLTNQWKHER